MGFRLNRDATIKNLIPVLPGASTVQGFVSSSDIGKLAVASSNNAVLAVGTTADFTQSILGIVASVPVATTPGSSQVFYIQPVLPGEIIEGTFSTTFSTALPATTDIGKYVGFSNTTTVAGAESLSMATLSNVKATTSGCFFKITGFDLNRRVLFGTVNSSHLAL